METSQEDGTVNLFLCDLLRKISSLYNDQDNKEWTGAMRCVLRYSGGETAFQEKQ